MFVADGQYVQILLPKNKLLSQWQTIGLISIFDLKLPPIFNMSSSFVIGYFHYTFVNTLHKVSA